MDGENKKGTVYWYVGSLRELVIRRKDSLYYYCCCVGCRGRRRGGQASKWIYDDLVGVGESRPVSGVCRGKKNQSKFLVRQQCLSYSLHRLRQGEARQGNLGTFEP